MSADLILGMLDLDHGDQNGWFKRVGRRLCLGKPGAKHMSGGACTAILVGALEHHTGKPLIQANTQFFQTPGANEEIEITLWAHRPGRSIDLAAAQMTSNGHVCAHIMGSFGARASSAAAQWSHAPDVQPPERCEPLPFIRADEGDLHTLLDIRMASAPEQGQLRFWARAREAGDGIDSRFLALVADFLPEAIHFNIGQPAGATSLDNAIRVVRRIPTDWILCSVQLSAVQGGLFHGSVDLYAGSGELLATGAQSGVVRPIS